MFDLALWSVISILLSLVAGHSPSYDYGFDVSKVVKRQLRHPILVRGAKPGDSTGNGEVPIRPEIRELEDDDDKWTLYLLGVSMMQFTDQTDPTSWYSITGWFFPSSSSESTALGDLHREFD